MKKLIATFAAIASLGLGSAVANFDLGGWFCDISTQGKMGFETENHMYGKKVGKEVFIGGVELAMPVCDGNLYTGITGFFPTDPLKSYTGSQRFLNDAGNRFEYKLGYMMDLACLPTPECFSMDSVQLSVDIGYKYYWWLQDNLTNPWNQVNRSNEIYAGLLTNSFLRPALYVFYDFNLEQFRLEGSIGYTYPLCFSGIDNVALDFNAYLGWLTADAYNGDQRQSINGVVPGKQSNGYTYGGVSADIVYSLNDCADIRVGIRWEANNDGKYTGSGLTANNYLNQGGTESRIWWGGGLYFGF
jgi:hypothetical protein